MDKGIDGLENKRLEAVVTIKIVVAVAAEISVEEVIKKQPANP